MPAGRKLRVLISDPAMVRWSTDGWQTQTDSDSADSGWSFYYVDLPTQALASGKEIVFTFYWKNVTKWEGTNFTVRVE